MNNVYIHSGLTAIASPYKGILLDAYGVFWGGNRFGALPGTKELMQRMVANGKIVGILSNSTQLAAKECAKFQVHGLLEGEHFHFLITSGEVSRHTFLKDNLPFATPNKKYFLSGKIHPKFASQQPIFEGTPYTETPHIDAADFIYISIPHSNGEDQIDKELFRNDVRKLVDSKLPMVCANPDRFAHEGIPPRAVVRQGTIAAMYEEEGGKVFYIGKPYALAYEMAMQAFNKWNIVDPSHVLMVGDTPETDIRGAKDYGMSSALVMHTGIMGDRITHHGLKNALKLIQTNEQPDFFIEKLTN